MTSILKVSTIQNTAGTAPTAGDLGLNVTGSVLQVKQAIGSTSVQNISSTSFASIGLSIDITPRDANSKFLVQGAMDIDGDANEQTYYSL